MLFGGGLPKHVRVLMVWKWPCPNKQPGADQCSPVETCDKAFSSLPMQLTNEIYIWHSIIYIHIIQIYIYICIYWNESPSLSRAYCFSSRYMLYANAGAGHGQRIWNCSIIIIIVIIIIRGSSSISDGKNSKKQHTRQLYIVNKTPAS